MGEGAGGRGARNFQKLSITKESFVSQPDDISEPIQAGHALPAEPAPITPELAPDAKTLALELPASAQTASATDLDDCNWQLSRIRVVMSPPVAVRGLPN